MVGYSPEEEPVKCCVKDWQQNPVCDAEATHSYTVGVIGKERTDYFCDKHAAGHANMKKMAVKAKCPKCGCAELDKTLTKNVFRCAVCKEDCYVVTMDLGLGYLPAWKGMNMEGTKSCKMCTTKECSNAGKNLAALNCESYNPNFPMKKSAAQAAGEIIWYDNQNLIPKSFPIMNGPSPEVSANRAPALMEAVKKAAAQMNGALISGQPELEVLRRENAELKRRTQDAEAAAEGYKRDADRLRGGMTTKRRTVEVRAVAGRCRAGSSDYSVELDPGIGHIVVLSPSEGLHDADFEAQQKELEKRLGTKKVAVIRVPRGHEVTVVEVKW